MAPSVSMRPGEIRTLTPGEQALCHAMFGARIDPGRVRLLAIPFWPRAFVPGGRLIVWPAAQAWRDFTIAPLEVQAVFVHEMTHVWQAQAGVNLLMAKLRAGDGPEAYAYDLSQTGDFSKLNIEQQAMVVQDAFLAARGGLAPHQAEAYATILATWVRQEGTRPRQV